MDDKTLEALVNERVSAKLAELQTADPALKAKLDDRQREQNRALQAMASSANAEPSSGYGSGREFGRGRELARLPGAQGAALAVMSDMFPGLRDA